MIRRIFRVYSTATVISVGALLLAQAGIYNNTRELVAHTQNDLQRSSGLNRRSDKEKERYDNAQKHLSEFDKELTKGRFDKDKLDHAIDDVKNVLEHNTLAPADRDELGRDLRDLRDTREHRGQ